MVIFNYSNSKKNTTWSFGDHEKKKKVKEAVPGYVIGHFLHNQWLDFYQIWNTTVFRYPPIPYPPPVVNHQGRILLWITMSHLWFDLIWLGSMGNKSESDSDLFPMGDSCKSPAKTWTHWGRGDGLALGIYKFSLTCIERRDLSVNIILSVYFKILISLVSGGN